MVRDLDEVDWLQIDQAARGCVSGSIREWPLLARALHRSGRVIDDVEQFDIYKVRMICIELVNERDSN